ncbi:MAG TPA: DUF333 domain-containing protein [Candidatus Nanoarchaeia archaeon]|nr:DUF333 domain-containing protein [Candidatus Nanoarchaeia archaeon]
MKKVIILFLSLIFVISIVGIALAEESNLTFDETEIALIDSNNSSVGDDTLVISPGIKHETLVVTKVTKMPRAESIYCEKQGYSSAVRKDSTGKEYSVCVFPDGKECTELEFLRGKCGRDYAGLTKEQLVTSIVDGTNNRLKSGDCTGGCLLESDGRIVSIKNLDGKDKEIGAEEISAKTDLDLSVENIDGEILLRAYLSNGRWALIKYMPDSASEKAIETLGTTCEERNCSIELTEVSVGGAKKLAYEVSSDKESRVLFLFKKKLLTTIRIDAETGKMIGIEKPWWSFLSN